MRQLSCAGQFLPGFFVFHSFHICQRTDCLAQKSPLFANGLQVMPKNTPRPAWWRAARSQQDVLGCRHFRTHVRNGTRHENRSYLSTLGLSAGRPGAAGGCRSPSVYGAFPESGCLGSWRFCKFFVRTGLVASRLQQKSEPGPGLALRFWLAVSGGVCWAASVQAKLVCLYVG